MVSAELQIHLEVTGIAAAPTRTPSMNTVTPPEPVCQGILQLSYQELSLRST